MCVKLHSFKDLLHQSLGKWPFLLVFASISRNLPYLECFASIMARKYRISSDFWIIHSADYFFSFFAQIDKEWNSNCHFLHSHNFSTPRGPQDNHTFRFDEWFFSPNKDLSRRDLVSVTSPSCIRHGPHVVMEKYEKNVQKRWTLEISISNVNFASFSF